MCDNETGQVLYETMFVWNEFLTRGIRNILQNTIWTVALVYGFFKQVRLLNVQDVMFQYLSLKYPSYLFHISLMVPINSLLLSLLSVKIIVMLNDFVFLPAG